MNFVFDFPRYLAAKKTVDDRALNKDVWQSLKENMPDNPLVLEVGVGIGTMFERMIEQGFIKDGKYTAVDNQPENIASARKRLTGIPSAISLQLETADLYDFAARPENEKTYDVLIAHAFLDLLDISQALPCLFSLLKSDGLFYFSLNFDGHTIFEPVGDQDFEEQIVHLYHQTMDERLVDGRVSGDSRSGRHLFHHLHQNGASILAAGSSDWVVFAGQDGYPAEEKYFLQFIIHTIQQALTGNPQLDAEKLNSWIQQRLEQIEAGDLVYIAHQLDFIGRI